MVLDEKRSIADVSRSVGSVFTRATAENGSRMLASNGVIAKVSPPTNDPILLTVAITEVFKKSKQRYGHRRACPRTVGFATVCKQVPNWSGT